jgi:hypothetical protein
MRVRRSLRSSFVVTVASTALLSTGCGPTVVTAGDAGDAGDAATSCPQSLPALASPCAPEGQRCGYGDCATRLASVVCTAGRWTDGGVMTCNPPPPDAGPPPCPTSAPTTDAPCPLEGQSCSWGTCPPTGVTLGQCLSGRWSLQVTSCNPPPDVPPTPDA